MKRSKELHPVQSKNVYTAESKRMHQVVNVGSGIQVTQFTAIYYIEHSIYLSMVMILLRIQIFRK